MKYLVMGRVHPERADINFVPQVWRSGDDGSVTVSCEASQLTVIIDLPDLDGFVSAFIAAEHIAQSVVSSFGFALGTGYTVELIQLVEETNESHVFGTRPGDLHFDPWEKVFVDAVELAKRDVFFRLALRDYVRAINEAIDCAFYCYRAIEAVKSAFGRGDWPQMHLALGTRREDIEQTVKVFADPVRHGNWISTRDTTSAQRYAMLQLTRDILAKYLTHRQF